jgi:hypothetical protein
MNPEPQALTAQVGMLAAKSLAGVGEGAVLGVAQGVMLRRFFTGLHLGPWILMTVLIAVFGWAAGSAVSIFGNVDANAPAVEPRFWSVLPFTIFFGLFAGALFGLAQSVVLKRAAEESHWWIYANAAGWAVAIPVVYWAASLDYSGHGLWAVIAIGTAAGLIAGAIVGAVTGIALLKMKPIAAPARTP